jgi:hypothetical protein
MSCFQVGQISLFILKKKKKKKKKMKIRFVLNMKEVAPKYAAIKKGAIFLTNVDDSILCNTSLRTYIYYI